MNQGVLSGLDLTEEVEINDTNRREVSVRVWEIPNERLLDAIYREKIDKNVSHLREPSGLGTEETVLKELQKLLLM